MSTHSYEAIMNRVRRMAGEFSSEFYFGLVEVNRKRIELLKTFAEWQESVSDMEILAEVSWLWAYLAIALDKATCLIATNKQQIVDAKKAVNLLESRNESPAHLVHKGVKTPGVHYFLLMLLCLPLMYAFVTRVESNFPASLGWLVKLVCWVAAYVYYILGHKGMMHYRWEQRVRKSSMIDRAERTAYGFTFYTFTIAFTAIETIAVMGSLYLVGEPSFGELVSSLILPVFTGLVMAVMVNIAIEKKTKFIKQGTERQSHLGEQGERDIRQDELELKEAKQHLSSLESERIGLRSLEKFISEQYSSVENQMQALLLANGKHDSTAQSGNTPNTDAKTSRRSVNVDAVDRLDT
jgi:hypothetical protein